MFLKLFLMFPISNICENICVKINILILADVSLTQAQQSAQDEIP